jgi:hypothetical protein
MSTGSANLNLKRVFVSDSGSGSATLREGGSGSSSGHSPGTGFPADYMNVRRAREKANPSVELPTVDGNRRKSAKCLRLPPGFNLKNDDRQHSVNNYHIPALKKKC